MFDDRQEQQVQTDAALVEANRLLERWRFAASASGLLWIQPAMPRLAPEELATFLVLLRRACDGGLPWVVLFDFSESEIVGAQWTAVESLLNEFAASLGARCRITSSTKRPVATILLYRPDAAAAVASRSSQAELN